MNKKNEKYLNKSEINRDDSGTASSIWAVTRILNLFIIFRAIRSMPHFTNYGIIMGTISDGMRNLKAFIGILIVKSFLFFERFHFFFFVRLVFVL